MTFDLCRQDNDTITRCAPQFRILVYMRMHNSVLHMLSVWLMQCAYAYACARNNIQCRFQPNVRCDT